jgi:hypothetical protein
MLLFFVDYYWGCARGFGRGTLYMKWGHGGCSDSIKENRKSEKMRKSDKMIK